jgi:acyl-CoA synthetase (AMP-forming)/AMP-acid ligase II
MEGGQTKRRQRNEQVEKMQDSRASHPSTILQDETLWGLMMRRAAATPDAVMLLDAQEHRLTFRQVADAAERLAAGLMAQGVKPGMQVTWQLPTRVSTVLLTLALARLGAVQNPIIHLYRERETSAVLRQSGSEVFVVPPRFGSRDFVAFARDVVAELPKPPRVLVFDEPLPDADPATLPPPPTSGEAARWVVYTSGTTADPKGVRHCDRSIMAAGYGLATHIGLDANDVGTIAYPVAHIGGPIYLAMMLMNGMSAVMLESFVPAEAAVLFARLGVTQAGGSTSHYQAFLAEQRKRTEGLALPALRVLTGGGAPKPPELYRQVKNEMNVPILHGYGMTEVPLIAQGSLRDSDDQLMHTEGAVVPRVEVRIVKSDGQLAAPGEDGEVRVRGATVCLGYTSAEATAAAFDQDGFFRTGDLGHLRSDGHVTLTGRLKDVIIRKGENIAAKELEDLLFEHPKVGSVAVIGLPDAERGERVCAVVETRPGAEPLTFAEMTAFLKKTGLMVQKIPEQLEIVDSLPRNDTLNKVLKHKLRERFSGKS